MHQTRNVLVLLMDLTMAAPTVLDAGRAQDSKLPTSTIVALSISIAIFSAAVCFAFCMVCCLCYYYHWYRHKKNKLLKEEEQRDGEYEEKKQEYELTDVPTSKAEDKHKMSVPKKLQQFKQSLKAGKPSKSYPEGVNKKEVARANFLDTETEYKDATIADSPDCGSRLQKLWTQLRLEAMLPGQEGVRYVNHLMMTVMPVSLQCRIHFHSLKNLKKLLVSLQKCPYIHPTLQIWHDPDTKHVVTIQPYVVSGSLKDYLYHCKPNTSWSSKYKKAISKPYERIGLYGRQILEAMLFLRGIQRFPMLGHVQSGNIFTEGEDCRLGGYENTLLGYKTRLYKLFKENLDHIDVLMFGHLMFEMTCGYELTTTTPTSDDYSVVKKMSKDSRKNLTEVLEFIFKSDGRNFPTLKEVAQLPLFCNAKIPHFDEWNEQRARVTDKASKYLRKVLK